MKTRIIHLRNLTLLLIMLLLAGCAWPHSAGMPLTAPEKSAAVLLQQMLQANPELQSFKGSGRLRVWHQGVPQSFRVAWVASLPNRLRLVLRGVSGLPLVTLAADGETIYLRQHEQPHQVRHFSAGEADLHSILGVAVSVTDVVALLAGRIPEYPYHRAWAQVEPADETLVLLLKRRWNRDLALLRVDPLHLTPKQIDYFDGAGALAYNLVFEDMQTWLQYTIPQRLVCRNAHDDGFELDVDSFQADIAIDASIFKLL